MKWTQFKLSTVSVWVSILAAAFNIIIHKSSESRAGEKGEIYRKDYNFLWRFFQAFTPIAHCHHTHCPLLHPPLREESLKNSSSFTRLSIHELRKRWKLSQSKQCCGSVQQLEKVICPKRLNIRLKSHLS